MARNQSVSLGLSSLSKPEYVFRPTQLLRRLRFLLSKPTANRLVTRLPWGWPITVDPWEAHGKALLHLGVYDLAVSEVLWRLCDKKETALDLGANIGYMTALLAKRVGDKGRVLCFEASPTVAAELQGNVARWRVIVGQTVIQVFEVAVSNCEGSVRFQIPMEAYHNRGLGRVIDETGCDIAHDSIISVASTTLDCCLDGVGKIGVAKMDVEGHEEKVLRGGQAALRGQQIRDWVFEHHPAYPSEVTNLFEQHGYTIFRIKKCFFGPQLVKASIPRASINSVWEAPSFLATLDAARATKRMKSRGWQCMG